VGAALGITAKTVMHHSSAIYRKLVKELALYRRRNLVDGAVLPHSAAEHRAILKAIASGDAELAGKAMYDHVIESRERALSPAHFPQPARARAGRKA
jgi:DNA-binding GntR family transcriptional regulator